MYLTEEMIVILLFDLWSPCIPWQIASHLLYHHMSSSGS